MAKMAAKSDGLSVGWSPPKKPPDDPDPAPDLSFDAKWEVFFIPCSSPSLSSSFSAKLAPSVLSVTPFPAEALLHLCVDPSARPRLAGHTAHLGQDNGFDSVLTARSEPAGQPARISRGSEDAALPSSCLFHSLSALLQKKFQSLSDSSATYARAQKSEDDTTPRTQEALVRYFCIPLSLPSLLLSLLSFPLRAAALRRRCAGSARQGPAGLSQGTRHGSDSQARSTPAGHTAQVSSRGEGVGALPTSQPHSSSAQLKPKHSNMSPSLDESPVSYACASRTPVPLLPRDADGPRSPAASPALTPARTATR